MNVAVKDNAGKSEVWQFQGNPPHMLQKDGITRDLIKPGTAVNVTGFLPRLMVPNSFRKGFAREIELPNGRKLPFGSLTWGQRDTR